MRGAGQRVGLVQAAAHPDVNRLLTIAGVFGFTSVLSFGGTNAVLPHLRIETVDVRGWMSDRDFVECFAIAQVTPGPSTTVATLLGYQAHGIPGAAVATFAMIVPSCVVVFLLSRVWQGTGDALWHKVLEKGLSPVGLGLIAAAGLVLSRSINHDWLGWAITAASGALLATTRVNPLLVIGLGGLAGLLRA